MLPSSDIAKAKAVKRGREETIDPLKMSPTRFRCHQATDLYRGKFTNTAPVLCLVEKSTVTCGKGALAFLNGRGCWRLGEKSGIGTTCGKRSKPSSIHSLFTSAQLFAKCAISFTNPIFLNGPGYMKPPRRTKEHWGEEGDEVYHNWYLKTQAPDYIRALHAAYI